MSSFTGFDAGLFTTYDAQASLILGADHWRVTKGFHYYLDQDNRTGVSIPYGYLTDGASVPRLFWNLIPPWGSYGQAAVVHDLLCEYLSMTYGGMPHTISRKDADDLLNEMMGVLNVPVVTRNIIYAAVLGYAIVCNVNQPSTTALKRKLEADWVIANPEPIYTGNAA